MSFTGTIALFSKQAPEDAKRIIRAGTIALFSAVIKDSPVDTGRLRSNWRCSIGKPNREEQSSVSKGGTAATREVLETAPNIQGDETVILTNNLPYAFRIEYEGWSHTKAPQGMVRKNVARAHQLFKKRYDT